jgi:hypothetical protein
MIAPLISRGSAEVEGSYLAMRGTTAKTVISGATVAVTIRTRINKV